MNFVTYFQALSLRQAISSLYQNPTFVARDGQRTSECSSQIRGLRQGCPLSHDLFSFVLTRLFEDVEQYVGNHGISSGVLRLGTSLWDLEYADDTVLLSNPSFQAQTFLHLIQKEGACTGLYLNFDKCEHLRLNSTHQTNFDPPPFLLAPIDALAVPLSDAVKYLGVDLDLP